MEKSSEPYLDALRECAMKFLWNEDVAVVLYGSRARKDSTRFSDFDIGIIPRGGFDRKKITLLREAVDNLNIPYKVDIVDFSHVSDEFRETALREAESWKD